MRIFTLSCSLLLLTLGAAAYYGWGVAGEGARTLVSAIPAGFGALMLLGVALALLLRRTGMQIALLAALGGGFSALGRLAPPYLKGSLDATVYPIHLITAMAAICLLYIVVRMVAVVLPIRSKTKSSEEQKSDEEPGFNPC